MQQAQKSEKYTHKFNTQKALTLSLLISFILKKTPKKTTTRATHGGADPWPVSHVLLSVHGAMSYCLVKVSSANRHGILTQNIGRSVSGNETRVVPIAHPFLQDPSAEILSKTAARCHQTVVTAVCLRKSADDSSGNQSTVRQHGQHHLRHQLPPKKTGQASSPASSASTRAHYYIDLLVC